MSRHLGKLQPCLPGSRSVRRGHFGFPRLMVSFQPVFKTSCLNRHPSFDHCQVDFFHRSLPKLCRQSGCSFACAGENDYARNRFIQSLNDAQEDIPGLPVLLFEAKLRQPIERFLLAGKMRSRDPGRLGNDQAMVVFEKDLELRHVLDNLRSYDTFCQV